ncbi:MAG: GspE/PulE family protein [Bacteroidota bacterium]
MPIPDALIQHHRLTLAGEDERSVRICFPEPPDAALLRTLAFCTGKRVVAVEEAHGVAGAAAPERPGPANAAVIGQGDGAMGMPAAQIRAGQNGHPAPAPVAGVQPGPPARYKASSSLGRGTIVQQVDQIIQSAIEQQASDIHIEPYETLFRVRYRLDGVLHTVTELSLLQKDALISRLKIMAELDIAEKRRPQDGRIRFQQRGRTVDLRVSTLPTDFGEKVVLRILDKSHLTLRFESLGVDARHLRLLRQAIHRPYGMILVTGPTGSGKTTTLYAALSEINTDGVNITTIEDPIEYNLPGINQTHVRSDIGFTFAQALRAFLRQDPNVIMVGEIRDAETASIAVRAALTGHLVLSTLHTNDAPSTITRLVDMGVEPFLVASSVRLILAQRLVRRICSACKQEADPDPAVLEELGLTPGAHTYHQGVGCEACHGTGYSGRVGLFELLPVGEATAELIAQRVGLYELRAHARTLGLPMLREAALERAQAGQTTLEEVLRETAL